MLHSIILVLLVPSVSVCVRRLRSAHQKRRVADLMASYDAASFCHVGLQLQREELLQLCVLHFKAVNNEPLPQHTRHTLSHTLFTPSSLQRERQMRLLQSLGD